MQDNKFTYEAPNTEGACPVVLSADVRGIRPQAVLPQEDVPHFVGMSRSKMMAQIKAGTFAPRVKLSAGRYGFLVSDLIAWAAARREQPTP
ncbi:MAG: AlpA family phage regulatory protein [Microbispora sp.]|nr:AlpA family phage regulatory protein [Microbispora sp.]